MPRKRKAADTKNGPVPKQRKKKNNQETDDEAAAKRAARAKTVSLSDEEGKIPGKGKKATKKQTSPASSRKRNSIELQKADTIVLSSRSSSDASQKAKGKKTPKEKAVSKSSTTSTGSKSKKSKLKKQGTSMAARMADKEFLKSKEPFVKSVSFSLAPYLTDTSWQAQLSGEMGETYFQKLEQCLGQDYAKNIEIFPPKELIFNAFNSTPFDKVKVVILGQDPYHDAGQAYGLSFAVPKDLKVPRSLMNIYKELDRDTPGFTTPPHGSLDSWTERGVLLLNATLTVEAHEPNSHEKYGWQIFTDKVIKILSDQLDGLVFILWGGFAHKKAALIDEVKHAIIKTAHPSPLSFNKFMGCGCFTDANKALQKFGKEPINWSIPH